MRCGAGRCSSPSSAKALSADDDPLARLDGALGVVGRVADRVRLVAVGEGGQGAAAVVDGRDLGERAARRSHRSGTRRSTSPPAGRRWPPRPTRHATPVAFAAPGGRSTGVGRPSASSSALVCSDCVPPRTAASAWTVVRTTLTSGCWAVRVDPPVWTWKRIAMLFGSRRAEPVAGNRGPDAARGAELGDLLEQVVVGGEEEGEARRELVERQAGGEGRLAVGDRVGDGEGDLLHGGRARLAHVVAADADRVPGRQLGPAVGEGVGHQAHRRHRAGRCRSRGRCTP